MISAHAITSSGDAAGYHDKSFTKDGISSKADNYYANEQSSAVWKGKGARILGIEGTAVTKEAFVALLDGKLKNPETGLIEDLAANSSGNRRPGFDFTIAPPKSVSIVGLVGGDERVVEAHQLANARAMAWLEKNAAVIRVRADGGPPEARLAGNLLYATVQHETNRNNEPQLHNHNVIVSAVYDDEGKRWRSLTNDQLLILRTGADAVYKAELVKQLQAIGYKVDVAANQVDFEIAGMSRDHIEAFSQRSAEIKAALAARGIDSEQADFHQRQMATVDSRAAKTEHPREALHGIWQEVAQQNGLDVDRLVLAAREAAAGQQRTDMTTREQARALEVVGWAVAHLSEREQAFASTDIEVQALRFGGVSIDRVEWAIEAKVRQGQLLDRGVSDLGAQVYTTPKAIHIEQTIIGAVREGVGRGGAVMSSTVEFEGALTAFEARKAEALGKPFALSDEQVMAARNLLMHPDMYQGVQGDAGTGKTAMLEFVKEAAEARGWGLMGMATTSAAAKTLEADSGIPSQTVAGFLHDRENAIRLAKLELTDLQAAVRQAVQAPEGAKSVEVHRLSVRTGFIDHGEARYTFDHERGDVFKSPATLRNALGSFLLDSADRLSRGAAPAGERETLLQRMQAGASELAADAGRRVTTYERVGITEEIAARRALSFQQDHGVGKLQYQIGAKLAEISNLERTGTKDGRKLMLVMDESSMTGAEDTLAVTRLGRDFGSRVILQGDIKQHGSVPAGRAFEQAQQAGMMTSRLQETRRFDHATAQAKSAAALLAKGNVAQAIERLDRFEVSQSELAKTAADRYMASLVDLQSKGIAEPRIGIVALTNADRKEVNAAVHAALCDAGHVGRAGFEKVHLDDRKLTAAEHMNAGLLSASGADTLLFRKGYREIGVKAGDAVHVVDFDVARNRVVAVNGAGKQIQFDPRKQDYFTAMKAETRTYGVGDKIEARANIKFEDKAIERITNGTRGVISAVDKDGATIQWADFIADGKGKGSKVKTLRELRMTNEQLRFVDLAYAHTSVKEQGATNDRELFVVSETGAKVINKQAAYVAGTRGKDNTEIITSDYATMIKNAGKEARKTTAVDVKNTPHQARTAQILAALDGQVQGVGVPGQQPISERGASNTPNAGQQPSRATEQERQAQRIRNLGFTLE